MTTFNLPRLLRDVFDPQPGETALVIVDVPHGSIPDHQDWKDRRDMAADWQKALVELGVPTPPVLFYPATGANNGDLPLHGQLDGKTVVLHDLIAKANIVTAMTRYSATAPLSMLTRRYPKLRVASMPNVLRRMEQSALAADYTEVARKANLLADLLERAERAEITFDTGHHVTFDLRHRHAHADDGMCRPDKQGFRLINLPSGEAFIVPYEGERPGDPSRTRGEIPLSWKGQTCVVHVEQNRITDISGPSPAAEELRAHFDVDPARRNIAELGLGCNDRAIITGNVLEDEKAGFHWAYGRSEHLGGTVAPDAFSDPAHVVHHDIVYAPGCPITIRRLDLLDPSGQAQAVIINGAYLDT
ncbi:MAG TPA: aminopeptidase [Kiritimatiellia bacterium]|nr:aminopeptidase [Kiritimatiellia bacterium]